MPKMHGHHEALTSTRNRQLILGVGRVRGTGWPGLCSLYPGCLPFGTLFSLRLRKEFWEICHWSLPGSLRISLSSALAPPPSLAAPTTVKGVDAGAPPYFFQFRVILKGAGVQAILECLTDGPSQPQLHEESCW